MLPSSLSSPEELNQLADEIKSWAVELGFAEARIVKPDLAQYKDEFNEWLNNQYHAGMDYLANHGDMRFYPEQLHPGTRRVISLRMHYLPQSVETVERLKTKDKAYIARYALGRDYHKLIRKRLTQLAKKIEQKVGDHGYRAFVDSAPILERQIAEQAGMGWIGKNTLLLTPKAGSWFLLGEIFTNLPLPVDKPTETRHCGSCTACLTQCPTDAFVEPWVLDAGKCISYLTIEHKGPIPEELRSKMGNRIFGCDDCQLVCPWTKFAKYTEEDDFQPRHNLDSADLVELFEWNEEAFLKNTEGSPIRRTGFENWRRNIAVALGNAPTNSATIQSLENALSHSSELVKEHIVWALKQHDL
ncbi:MAG: tRNA epoxyqueuosine(34) reductase QueG [Gammaproteobacteria bacterium]|nr:tRNA epoxyqueuosine(34) reductase QueG [Gammaproteobacteria bacterium]MBU1465124.1 tRNA epoxyqueuosine(34) reductase QueG [Gammaproteobacteria bacterium]MBU2025072.1 tRNA epoxyqueuosine(34) reductase QueG [Gammaproteobacteria bacterium]MBU2238392.1 tRNA epoxyqueuosine(34) reductase QueG [Gammaproteobacteria bacterium]MBU2320157.1 tRNA epoxyqueuosine(34) reductase QueG [Gammaproteobacteria bacterium]